METILQIPVGHIILEEGVLRIGQDSTSVRNKHYDITATRQEDGSVLVVGYQPIYFFNFRPMRDERVLSLLLDSEVLTYRKWPWSKAVSRKSRIGWVETKTRVKKTYRGVNWELSDKMDEQ